MIIKTPKQTDRNYVIWGQIYTLFVVYSVRNKDSLESIVYATYASN